jgi:hypothetical protein
MNSVPYKSLGNLGTRFVIMRDNTFPPFPTDVPVHPLLVIDYVRIKSGDEAEVKKLWKAATELGFW